MDKPATSSGTTTQAETPATAAMQREQPKLRGARRVPEGQRPIVAAQHIVSGGPTSCAPIQPRR
jgi:hypothetical protein